MSAAKRTALLDLLVAALLGAGTFALRVSTLAPTLLAGDGGEFQFVPYLLGLAHPTGYPLYSLLGWAWSHLLWVGDVAYRMNLFSAFCAALAVALLYPTARAVLRQALPGLPAIEQRFLGALAAACFAVTPTFWAQSVRAEVYPLHILLLLAVVYLVLRWGELRLAAGAGRDLPPAAPVLERSEGAGGIEGGGLLVWASFVFGLGLAHHRTLLLLAPALLAYVWLIDRRVFLDRRLVLKALAALVLPLALYLYIPWRAPRTPYLRLPLAPGRELVLYENTPAGFVRFVLGSAFGGSIDLTVDLGERLSLALRFFRAELGWVGLALALAGAAFLAVARRWALLALTGLAFLATLAFDLVYVIGDIVVQFIPAFLIAVLWLAVGVVAMAQALVALAARRSQPLSRVARAAVLLPFLALPVAMALDHYAGVDESYNTAIRANWDAILAEPLPRDAVLVTDNRDEMMPFWYLQYVGDGLPQRPDLLGLFPLITPDYPTLGSVLDLALGTGRPVYLIKAMPGVEIKVDVQPLGRLWRVLGPSVKGEPAYKRDHRLAGAVALAGYDLSPPNPSPGDELGVSLYWEALHPLPAAYHSYVHLIDASGQKVAQDDGKPGGVYYPSTMWRPGERLRDDRWLKIPPGVAPGTYHLVAGMYVLAGGEIEPVGDAIELGEVQIGPEPVGRDSIPASLLADRKWLDAPRQGCQNSGRNPAKEPPTL
jgi:hypothetical protein